ncbi:MAG: TFIIB-type zinc ribbon-containing protein [Nitrososphaerota archaeon]|nr:TFIIB-type zinc ribbon-containing protein [Nitrososphaerota archaeon]
MRRRLSSEEFEELCLALGMCLECGGSLVRAEGEVVCVKCGRVWGEENVDENIPFPDEGGTGAHFEGHWQPGSSLCFLKGLGDPALENNGGKGLMRILALSPAEGEDLGLRARQIKVMAQMEDPPQLRRILTRVSLLLDKFGMRGNHEIADYMGNLARKIVAFCLIAQLRISTRLADAIVKHALEKLQTKAPSEAETLSYKSEELEFVAWFEEATQKFKLKRTSKKATI